MEITSCLVKTEPVDSLNESSDFDRIQEPDLIDNFPLKEESFNDVYQETKATFTSPIKEEKKEQFLFSDSCFNHEKNPIDQNVNDESGHSQIDRKNVTVKVELEKLECNLERSPNVPLKEETDELLKCDSCAYETKRRSDLTRHIIIKHREGTKLFKCKRCPYKAKLKVYLNKHFDRTHRRHTELFKCDSCAYETKKSCNLRTHIYRHHREDIEVFKCDSCSFVTKVKNSLKLHFNCIHRERTTLFQCDYCPFRTVFRSNLKVHFDRKHKDHTEMFKCDLCPYETKIKFDFDKHINRKHIA